MNYYPPGTRIVLMSESGAAVSGRLIEETSRIFKIVEDETNITLDVRKEKVFASGLLPPDPEDVEVTENYVGGEVSPQMLHVPGNLTREQAEKVRDRFRATQGENKS